MGRIEITSDEGNYKTRAYDFRIEDDLYMFFEFESPKSKCTIGIAYDQFIDSYAEWYVHDGELSRECDAEIVDAALDKLWGYEEFAEFQSSVQAARDKFNRSQCG